MVNCYCLNWLFLINRDVQQISIEFSWSSSTVIYFRKLRGIRTIPNAGRYENTIKGTVFPVRNLKWHNSKNLNDNFSSKQREFSSGITKTGTKQIFQ